MEHEQQQIKKIKSLLKTKGWRQLSDIVDFF